MQKFSREKDNKSHIYLYDVGEYRIAFEHSAWRLCRLFSQAEGLILHLKTYPFPVVMVTVADKSVWPYFRQHIVRT